MSKPEPTCTCGAITLFHRITCPLSLSLLESNGVKVTFADPGQFVPPHMVQCAEDGDCAINVGMPDCIRRKLAVACEGAIYVHRRATSDASTGPIGDALASCVAYPRCAEPCAQCAAPAPSATRAMRTLQDVADAINAGALPGIRGLAWVRDGLVVVSPVAPVSPKAVLETRITALHEHVRLAQDETVYFVKELAPMAGQHHAHANVSEAAGLLGRVVRLLLAAQREVEAHK